MDDQDGAGSPKARPDFEIEMRAESLAASTAISRTAAMAVIRAALEANLSAAEVVRGMTRRLLDAWQARQLAPSTARLYRRVYGRRAPGSTRTKRLRKKRLSRLPMLETIEARFALQRAERVNLSPREQAVLWNQGLRERGAETAKRIHELRERWARIATYPEEVGS